MSFLFLYLTDDYVYAQGTEGEINELKETIKQYENVINAYERRRNEISQHPYLIYEEKQAYLK